MRCKYYFFLVCFAQITLISHSQSSCITQNGKIVYECGYSNIDSSLKSNYAVLGNNYIQHYYKNKKTPPIYLCLSTKANDTLIRYEISYDNLKGNSIENHIYERNRNYDKPGIRIQITSDKYHPLEFLKLLEYGIINSKKLRRVRNRIKSTDLYSRPDSVSLSQEEIKNLLSQNLLHPIP
ncbi:MAG TPA: hypothetical protein VK212_04520 [Lentimicrobium sp.]|nr:hypothetical protein [Lentimicrobium sp.]